MSSGDRRPRFVSADSWAVPAAERPVRSRVRVAVAEAESSPSVLSCATFAAAAVVTGGTVLVRNWPSHSEPVSSAARAVFAAAGSYVVRSADGLTVTSRATSGELGAIDVDLAAAPSLFPLAAVIAALAPGRSTFRGVAESRVRATAANLRAVGVLAETHHGMTVVEPLALRPGRWDGAAGPEQAGAGVVLGLRVPGIEVTGMAALRTLVPGFDRAWVQLLAADEYLIPGSAKLPHEYL